MQRTSRLAMALLLVVVGCVALLTFAGRHPAAAMLQGEGSSAAAPPVPPSPPPPGSFAIAGDIGGLYPGASRQLVLVVSNPQHFSIVVTSIQTVVGNASTSCSGSFLSVGTFAGQLQVPGNGHASVTVAVTLSHAAPDACQGAVFPLTYHGSAVKA
jgi:hypothetical protein